MGCMRVDTLGRSTFGDLMQYVFLCVTDACWDFVCIEISVKQETGSGCNKTSSMVKGKWIIWSGVFQNTLVAVLI